MQQESRIYDHTYETSFVELNVRIMWPNIIYMMPLLLTNKYSVFCEIMQYFYDVRY